MLKLQSQCEQFCDHNFSKILHKWPWSRLNEKVYAVYLVSPLLMSAWMCMQKHREYRERIKHNYQVCPNLVLIIAHQRWYSKFMVTHAYAEVQHKNLAAVA